jgi:hypothetical protein
MLMNITKYKRSLHALLLAGAFCAGAAFRAPARAQDVSRTEELLSSILAQLTLISVTTTQISLNTQH